MPTLRQSMVARFTRLYPFYSGCGTLANKHFVQRLAGQDHSHAWARVQGGELLAPLDDYIGRAAFFTGDLDRKISWICSHVVDPGDTVLDIGANIGLVSLLLASLVGPEGHVHAFEPNPVLLDLLKQTFDHNHLTNVTLHPFALGPSETVLNLRIPRVNAGAGSLIRNQANMDCFNHAVCVKRLSQVIEDEHIDRIRLVKIDVEGYEDQVFAGAQLMFERACPEMILFECNEHSDLPLHEQPVMRMLQLHDYRFLSIPKCMVRMRLEPFDPMNPGDLASHDFLAVRRGSYDRIAARVHVQH